MPATATTGYSLFDEFIPEILQYVHGAPTIMVRQHIKNIIIEFLERTMILKKDPSSFYLTEDEHTYKLKYNSDRYRAVNIKGDVRLGEEDTSSSIITVTSEHRLDMWLSKWRTNEGSKPTHCYLTEDVNKIRFYPIPNVDSTDEIFMTTAVTLKRDQTEVDEFIYEKYEETIQAGVLAGILSIPSASWANQALARRFAATYSRGVKRARAIALKGTGEQTGMVEPQNYEVMGSDFTIRNSTSWE